MKVYVLSFKKYDQSTIDVLRSFGLQPYIGMWGTRLCASVRLDEEKKDRLLEKLGARGHFPKCSEVFENQVV